MLKRMITVLLLCAILLSGFAFAEEDAWKDSFTFLLICNEGMQNDGGNVGNTVMAVSMDPLLGQIRLMIVTWDTFIDYEGFDIPQLLDQPYRKGGPEATLKVFNENFGTNIEHILSVNYLNLANLIDAYDGVNVDITRAERNALNGMVASKKENIQAAADTGLLENFIVEQMAKEYYLDQWGEDTHLNGLQAVAFGWLQYDSVYNCCLREIAVISDLFSSVGTAISNEAVFYTEDTGKPEVDDGRRLIDLDNITAADETYLYRAVSPIFDNSYNNLTDDEILSISITLGKSIYYAARQGVDVLGHIECEIFPLEARNEYDIVAGRKGHVIDKAANAEAIDAFLFAE